MALKLAKYSILLAGIGLLALGVSSCQHSEETYKDEILKVISCLKKHGKLKYNNFDRRIYVDSVSNFEYPGSSRPIYLFELLKTSSFEIYPVPDTLELNDYQKVYIDDVGKSKYQVKMEIYYDQLAEPWILRLNNNTRKLYNLKFMFFGCYCQIDEIEEDDWLIQM